MWLGVLAQQRELLELAEHYGNCMAFLDHGELTNKLSAAWNAVYDKVNQDKKHIVRKLRVLEADKNADPGVVESYKARRDRLQQVGTQYHKRPPTACFAPKDARAYLLSLW